MTVCLSSTIRNALTDTFPLNVIETVNEYAAFPLVGFVNLDEERILKLYLSKSYRQCLPQALTIVRRNYEVSTRQTPDEDNWTLIYSLHPEVLAYGMDFIKAKQDEMHVCEMGCATGDNGLLLALAGAKKITFNDIGSSALAQLRKELSTIPTSLRERCRVIQADCLELLQKNSELRNDVDLILCRNLMHFFCDEKLPRFFLLMKELLKAGGKAIISVNSVAAILSSNKEINTDFYKSTSFTVYRCSLYHPKTKNVSDLFTKVVPCSGSMVSDKRTLITLSEKIKISFKVNSVNANLNKINPIVRSEIYDTLKSNLDKIKKCVGGSIAYITQNTRAYSFQTLTDLFETNGFTVETAFDIRFDGHLNHQFFTDSKESQLVGVIVSKT